MVKLCMIQLHLVDNHGKLKANQTTNGNICVWNGDYFVQ